MAFSFAVEPLILKAFFGTMVINPCVISGSDPGAVPGDSTNSPTGNDMGSK